MTTAINSVDHAKTPLALDALTSVNQTLFSPVYSRAMETARRNGIIADPYAQRILKESGYDCSTFAGRRFNLIGTAVRTRRFDLITARFLADNPAGTVVVLGCGLDARPYRMDNGLARWISLDLPEVITLRNRFFTEDSRHEHLACSVLDREWLEKIPLESPVLILAEGLFMYLEEEQLRELVVAMAERFPGGTLAAETLSRRMVGISRRTDANGCGVAYTWGADSGAELEAWSRRIVFSDEFPYAHEERFRWGSFGLLTLLPMFRKIAKVSLFRFAAG